MPIRDFAICGKGFPVWERRREFLKRAIAHREYFAIAFDQGRNAIAFYKGSFSLRYWKNQIKLVGIGML
ncbi:hypothetical protein [Cylindrospermopsis raciborskii]|uniref:hypothetical protein n=1 Tax=Cylindrospermopsis raciborskii TaxID=77022 RepID=UPI0011788D04|nr:hypothetical protein [Cylindrospermopsis raciborskii]